MEEEIDSSQEIISNPISGQPNPSNPTLIAPRPSEDVVEYPSLDYQLHYQVNIKTCKLVYWEILSHLSINYFEKQIMAIFSGSC